MKVEGEKKRKSEEKSSELTEKGTFSLPAYLKKGWKIR
jgi:hypothetical protein